MGLRPEHLRLSGAHLRNAQKFSARVELVEPLGGETLVHAILQEQKVIARLEGNSALRPGESIELYIEADQQRFFDPQTGAAL